MTDPTRRGRDPEDALQSAIQRLPVAVVTFDSESNLRPLNDPAVRLFEREGIPFDLYVKRPAHPLATLIREIQLAPEGAKDLSATRTLKFPSGRRYEIEPSSRSQKGSGRWIMLLIRESDQKLDYDDLLSRWGFTRRETDVARELLEGKSSQEICDTLGISRDTLKTHLSQLFDKTNTRSRPQLLATLINPTRTVRPA